MDRVFDHLNKLTPLSTTYLREYQRSKVPTFLDFTWNRVFKYWYEDIERLFDGTEFICVKATNLKWKDLSNRKNKLHFTKPLGELVDSEEINPFLLFIDNKFIKWSNITVIHDYNEDYLMIHASEAAKEPITSVDILHFPFNIIYSEDGLADGIDFLDILFKFDQNGLMTLSDSITNTYISVISRPFFFEESISNMELKFIQSNVSNTVKIFPENFIVFKDGELFRCQVDVYQNNIFTIDDGNAHNNLCYKLFCDIDGSTSVDNVTQINTTLANLPGNIENKVYGNNYDKFIDHLTDFDPVSKTNNATTAEEYKRAVLTDVVNYNPRLLTDVYTSPATVFSVYYTGEYLNTHKNAENNFVIPRRRCKHTKDDFVMVFVNGDMYKYYRYVKYVNNTFVLPIRDIKNDDRVELLFFKDAENKVLKGFVDANEDRTFLDEDLFNDNLQLFCPMHPNADFEYPDYGSQLFEVPYYIEEPMPGEKRVKFNDPFFYNKPIYFCNSNQFRSNSFIAKEETVRFKLSDDFRTCNNPNKYMVFVNGRLIAQDKYQITMYGPEFPFYEQCIYLQIAVQAGETVDVFYVPTEFIDMNYETDLPVNGHIIIDNTKSKTSLSKDKFFVFINGKKIYKDDIFDLKENTFIIDNALTTKNVTVLRFVEPINEIYDIMAQAGHATVWDKMINEMNATQLRDIVGVPEPNYVILDINEKDIYTNVLPIQAVGLELMRDHYTPVRNVNKDNFVNAMDIPEIVYGQDPSNKDLIPATDATLEINLEVDRSLPKIDENGVEILPSSEPAPATEDKPVVEDKHSLL